jgi:hypothetical protein
MPDAPSAPRANENGLVWPGGSSLQGPHRVEAFALCPQLEGFGYDVHLRRLIEHDATLIGTLVHAGLAYRYGALLPQRPDWFVYPDGRHAIWTLGVGSGRQDAAEEALRVFDAYEAYRTVNTWHPLLVEHQFVVQMEGEPYSCRIDLLAIENGEVVLIDHKTQNKLNRQTAKYYKADRQMMTGLALARAHGWDVRRVVINALSKEYPTPRFERFDVGISELAYNRLGEDTRYFLKQMKAVRIEYPDPMLRPRNTGSCLRKYGPCDFIPLCTDGIHRLDEFKRT